MKSKILTALCFITIMMVKLHSGTVVTSMQMRNGDNQWIEYLASDDTPRRARLTETDVYGTGLEDIGLPNRLHTKDPNWIVKNPDGSTPEVEWQFFRATDGSIRKVRISCNYNTDNKKRIICRFVYANPNGSDEHDDHQIWFKHPKGGVYKVTINDTLPPFPKSPTFHVTDLPASAK